VILDSLGILDYGIYNVVAGVTSMFVFLNSTMSVSTSRFITYELATKNDDNIRTVFDQARIIHYAIAIMVMILIETIGMWMLVNKLTIPLDRIYAAKWVLHSVSITTFLTIISTPDMALIIAYERMNAFAYISMLDVFFKLLIAYLIVVIPGDRLITYAILLTSASAVSRVCYAVYCRRNFVFYKGRIHYNKKIFNRIFSFASWNLMGNLANMTLDQGITILINIFTNPTVNAARGVANQLSIQMNTLATNARMAINPQITKSYAAGDYSYMHKLIGFSSLSCYYILLIMALPLYWSIDYIMDIWLVEVPYYAPLFLRLTLVVLLTSSFSNPLIIGVHATGNIKRFQIVEATLMLLTLPLAYMFFKCGLGPEWAYIANIICIILAQAGRIKVVLPLIKFPFKDYFNEIIYKALKVLVLSLIPCLLVSLISQFMPQIVYYAIQTIISFVSCLFVIYYFGLTKEQVVYIKELKNRIFRR
jgi:O-antigen/teichoic acid export membrane protein